MSTRSRARSSRMRPDGPSIRSTEGFDAPAGFQGSKGALRLPTLRAGAHRRKRSRAPTSLRMRPPLGRFDLEPISQKEFARSMAAKRRADATWEGELLKGNGKVKFDSGALPETPITWAARTEAPGGKTSPEELLAGAHAGCYAMAFSNTLAKAGH